MDDQLGQRRICQLPDNLATRSSAKSHARVGKNMSQRWRLVWSGSGSAWSGLVKLIWVVLRLLLAGWVWGTAVRLAHFQPPVKTGGVVLAVVSVLLLIWGVWGLWRSISILGFKRLIVTLAFVYGLAVIINVLTIPDSRSFPVRLLTQLSFTGQQGWAVITSECWIPHQHMGSASTNPAIGPLIAMSKSDLRSATPACCTITAPIVPQGASGIGMKYGRLAGT